MLVGDNERVKAGQVLARIDERDFKVALDQAKADVAAARAAIASKQAQLDVQQAVDRRRKGDASTSTRRPATFAAQENKRYSDLATTGYGSVQNAQQAQSRHAGAQAAIQRDTANLASALKQVDLLKAEIAQAVAALARATPLQSQAELNLGYTTIVAPIDGVVGNRTLRSRPVRAGRHATDVAGADRPAPMWWPTSRKRSSPDVRKGQAVDIAVDMFPGHVVHGHVDSIAPASGQEFALLPPDNATGNFTKVVQRIPVKIALDLGDAPLELRPGMSVIPTHRDKVAERSPAPRPPLERRESRFPRGDAMSDLALSASTPLTRATGAPPLDSEPRQRHDLDRRARGHDRRVHGDPQHPDHQRLAAQHRGRHRHRRRQRLVDLDLVSDRRDHGHSAHRLSQPGVLVPPLHARERGAVCGLLGRLRLHRTICPR